MSRYIRSRTPLGFIWDAAGAGTDETSWGTDETSDDDTFLEPASVAKSAGASASAGAKSSGSIAAGSSLSKIFGGAKESIKDDSSDDDDSSAGWLSKVGSSAASKG